MIYKYKTGGKSPKYFNLNPREVLKNQNNFKSNLDKIRKGNPFLKSEDQLI